MTVRILIGDVSDKLRELPDESVHCVVTRLQTNSVQELASLVKSITPRNIVVREAKNRHHAPGSDRIGKVLFSDLFSFVAACSRLQFSEFKNRIGGFLFDAQIRKQGAQDAFRLGVGRLITKKWPPPYRTWLLSVISAAENLADESNCLLGYHAKLNAGVIGGGLSALTGICLRLFDADVSLAINKSGEISKRNSVHCHMPQLRGLHDYRLFAAGMKGG